MPQRRWPALPALVVQFALLSLLSPECSQAASPADYAYLRVQGKITDPLQKTPLVGATVRLTAETRVFEAITDRRGMFLFEKLSVRSYTVRITTAEGEVIRDLWEIDPGDPARTRLRIRLGRGPGTGPLIMPVRDRVEVLAPEPRVRWHRFWKQLAIFVGSAGILAL